MTTSRNGVQEEMEGVAVIAAAIAGGLCTRMDRNDAHPISATDVHYIAQMATAIYRAAFHVVMQEGEEGG